MGRRLQPIDVTVSLMYTHAPRVYSYGMPSPHIAVFTVAMLHCLMIRCKNNTRVSRNDIEDLHV